MWQDIQKDRKMGKNEERDIKGVRIRTINYAMIAIACVLYVMILYATVHLSLEYERLSVATDNYVRCVQEAGMVTEASDYLTMKARMYAVNKDPKHVKDYFTEVHVNRRRELALEELQKYNQDQKIYSFLKNALEGSNELMEREIYSMKLVAVAMGQDMADLPQEVGDMELTKEDESLSREAKLEKAVNMVFDSAYQDAKALITSNISYFSNSVLDATLQEKGDSSQRMRSVMGRQRLFISFLFVLNIMNFILVIILIVKPLQIYIRCIREDKMLEIAGSYEFKYLALTYNDIYEINEANEAMLRHKAEHDPLTGLINRGGFDQVRQLLEKQERKIALLLIDVDKFKEVNDGYGHEVGDLVLRKVAQLLKDDFRSKDHVARIGGDEFAIIMMDVTMKMTEMIQDKVRNINHILKNPNDGLPAVSLSVGVAFSERGFTDDLYRNTDSALYQVKENGRCGCDFYKE